MLVKGLNFHGNKRIDIQILKFGQRLGILASVIDKVVKTIGEERGGSDDSLIHAFLAGDVELDKLEGFGILSGQSSQLWVVGTTRGGDNEVGGVLELLIRGIRLRSGNIKI